MASISSPDSGEAVRWGILSTAAIGSVMTQAAAGTPAAEFVALAGRNHAKATQRAQELGISTIHSSYEDLLNDPSVEAVYIPLPISLHVDWTMAAIKAGKHVLCEKPLATTESGAAACFDAAESQGVHLVEGLMWREHPQTVLAQRLISEGKIGDVALIRAALSVDAPAGDIRRTGALGGGAHLDLGCYCVSALRLFGGELDAVSTAVVVDQAQGADGSDLRMSATATLSRPGQSPVLGQFDVALDYPRRDELEVIGTAGRIRIPDPWLCRDGYLDLTTGSGEDTETSRIDVDADPLDPYLLEIERVSQQIRGRAPIRFGRADAQAQAKALETITATLRNDS